MIEYELKKTDDIRKDMSNRMAAEAVAAELEEEKKKDEGLEEIRVSM